MLTTELIHPEILYHLAGAGHGAKILITDGNYPVTTKVKDSVPVVYLNLAPGQPGVVEVLGAVSSVCNWEAAEVMWPQDGHRPAIFDEFEEMLSLELSPLDRQDFYRECTSSEDLALVITTGEVRPYANLLLTVGVSTGPRCDQNVQNDRPKILVIGSFMMDLVVRTPRVPENGETIIGLDFHRFPGGKGANQAVAASRLGGKVTMAGKLGEDSFGDIFLEVLSAEGIDTRHILRDGTAATGIGAVTMDQQGNNRIVVVPGANMLYNVQELCQIEDLIAKSDMVMMQLEMDLEVITKAVELAHQHNVPILLNPAPAQSLAEDLLAKVTYLTPNETEAQILSGIKVVDVDTAAQAADVLRAKGVRNVIITLAEKGALISDDHGTKHVPGFPVQVVDTVAAGDAFNGALAVAVASGKSLAETTYFANAVGALAVTKQGAIPSLPSLSDVERFLAEQTKESGLARSENW